MKNTLCGITCFITVTSKLHTRTRVGYGSYWFFPAICLPKILSSKRGLSVKLRKQAHLRLLECGAVRLEIHVPQQYRSAECKGILTFECRI